MMMDWIDHNNIEGKYFVSYSKWIPGKVSKFTNKLVVTMVLWEMLWKLLFCI